MSSQSYHIIKFDTISQSHVRLYVYAKTCRFRLCPNQVRIAEDDEDGTTKNNNQNNNETSKAQVQK